jgi:DNA-binding transcriptional regulator YdaS (Cro superfamily)
MDLGTYITENGADIAELAKKLGVTKEAVRLWVAGSRTPRPDAMRRIVDATGGQVTPNDFLAATVDAGDAA